MPVSRGKAVTPGGEGGPLYSLLAASGAEPAAPDGVTEGDGAALEEEEDGDRPMSV